MTRNTPVIPDGRQASPEPILPKVFAAGVRKMGSGLRYAAPE